MQILNTLFGFKIVHGMVLCIVFQLYRQRQSAQISVKLGNNSILSKNLFFCGLKKNMHTSKLVDGFKSCRAHSDLTCATLFCKKKSFPFFNYFVKIEFYNKTRSNFKAWFKRNTKVMKIYAFAIL